MKFYPQEQSWGFNYLDVLKYALHSATEFMDNLGVRQKIRHLSFVKIDMYT